MGRCVGRRGEGRKGQRFDITLAQTGQVFDVYYRSGNVHDSHGAKAFLQACIEELRQELPGVKIEVRMDSAFFSDALVTVLDGMGVANKKERRRKNEEKAENFFGYTGSLHLMCQLHRKAVWATARENVTPRVKTVL